MMTVHPDSDRYCRFPVCVHGQEIISDKLFQIIFLMFWFRLSEEHKPTDSEIQILSGTSSSQIWLCSECQICFQDADLLKEHVASQHTLQDFPETGCSKTIGVSDQVRLINSTSQIFGFYFIFVNLETNGQALQQFQMSLPQELARISNPINGDVHF